MQPLISIIVPIYNVEPYLPRCIDSILAQTYSNFELILVDDGSPDDCGRICDSYATKDERIRVIHKANGGLSDARNAGLDIAEGELIGFVDSDDYIHPEMYAVLYKNMTEARADLSLCDYRSISDPDGNIFDFDNKVEIYNNTEALAMLFTYYCQVFVLAWNKLYRKEVFENFRYAKGKIHEDEFLTYKILHQSKKIVFTHARLYYYYQSPNSIIRTGFNPKKLHYAEAMEERLNYFRQQNLDAFYSQTLTKYTIWLLAFYFTYKKELKAQPESLGFITSRLSARCKEASQASGISVWNKLTYRLSAFSPSAMGYLAFQRLYRLNILSRFARILFG